MDPLPRVSKNAYTNLRSQDGVPLANAVANVAFNKDNKVVSFGSSFIKPSKLSHISPQHMVLKLYLSF